MFIVPICSCEIFEVTFALAVVNDCVVITHVTIFIHYDVVG